MWTPPCEQRMRARRPFPSPHVHLLAFTLACTALFTPSASLGAWSSNPAVNTAVSTTGGDQIAPRSVDDGTGGTLIVWADHRGPSQDIYALHLDRMGNIVSGWAPTGNPICTAPGDQDNPVIVSDGTDGAIIAWSDARSGSDDIYAVRVRGNASIAGGWSAGGTPVCTAPGNQGPVQAMEDGGGGIHMIWRDERNGNFDLYAQNLSGNGNLQRGWPAGGLAVCIDPADQDLASMTTDGNGGFFVAWQDERNADIDIYATRVRDSGRILGGWQINGSPMCNAVGNQFSPVLAYDDQRGAYIVWEDFRAGLTSDLYGIRVQQNGTLRNGWTADGNVICSAPGDQFTPVAIPDTWGNVIIAWEDYRNGIDNADIYAVKMRSNGSVFWFWPDNGLPVCNAPGFQFEPQLAPDGDHGAIVTWEDYRAGPGNANVYAKRVSWLGAWPNYWATDGIPVSSAAGHQQSPSVAGDGNVIIAWEDSRNGTVDIYAQRLEVQGTLGNNSPAAAAGPGQGEPPPGFVQLSWGAPPLDDTAATPLRIGSYRVWRDVAAIPPGTGAAPAGVTPTATVHVAENAVIVPGGAADAPGDTDALDPRMLSPDAPGESDGHEWRVLATIPASGSPLYTVNIAVPGEAGNPGYGLFRVEAIEATNENISWMSEWIVLWSTATTDAGPLSSVDEVLLGRPRPNPARGPVRIPLALADAGVARVGIYAADGRRVRSLNSGVLTAGQHALHWDRRDAAGRRVAAGIYFVRLEAAGEVRSRRLTILN